MNSTNRLKSVVRGTAGTSARAALLVASGLIGLVIAAAVHAQVPREAAEGELLVGLRAGVQPQQAQALYHANGAVLVDEIPQIGVQRIRVPAPALNAVQAALSRRPEVRFVEKNRIHEPADLFPNDPLYPSQWHLPQIDAPGAWDITQGAGVVIAILDSGVDPSHPDLAKLVDGRNFYDNNNDTSDSYGHGTEVAGVAGAVTNNATGVASPAGESPIMPIRVTDRQGRATSARLASGLVWAADNGARVMNLSFSGVAGSSTILSAAQYAVNHGALVVAAAGNCGCADPTPETPYLLSVSATDDADQLAYFSSTGQYVDLSAPGVDIQTTATVLGGLYVSDSGTSLSSPLVAGVGALMFAANAALTPADAIDLMESTALDLGAAGYDTAYGFGRVDAYQAVVAAESFVPPPDTAPPTASVTAPTAGATVSGTTVVDVAASDDVAVVQVDLYVDDVLLASSAASPYSFGWDTTAESNGSHTLQAVASDAAGNTGTSDPVSVTVWNAPPDTTPPAVVITSPTDGSHVTKTVAVQVHADDDTEVQQMRLFVDDSQLGSTVSCASSVCDAQFSWDTSSVSNGWHTLSAEAADAAGNVGASSAVTVRVH